MSVTFTSCPVKAQSEARWKILICHQCVTSGLNRKSSHLDELKRVLLITHLQKIGGFGLQLKGQLDL